MGGSVEDGQVFKNPYQLLLQVRSGTPTGDPHASENTGDKFKLLGFLDELEQMPFSTRTTEEMNADIQAERDAWG